MASLTDILSNFDLSWKDPISGLDVHQKALIGAWIGFTNVYGFLLIMPMVFFEKYGRDPQKRGLKSQVCILIITILNTIHVDMTMSMVSAELSCHGWHSCWKLGHTTSGFVALRCWTCQ